MATEAPGSVPFGRYLLQRRIAVGGMAEVYLAELNVAAGVRKQVVIKKILKRFLNDPSFVEMFVGEAQIAAGLSHGNVAQLFDFGEVDGEYYLAMEYVWGESLARVLTRAAQQGLRIPVEYGCYVALEMCKGLHYAHTRTDAQRKPLGIVHRDISPQNVLVSYEGQVKVVDFGIAKAYGADNPGRSQTAAGIVKGKYIYFSPEQARAQALDARTDVYATGVCLYELLTGQLPYDGEMVDVLGRIVRGEFARPSALNPAVPEDLDAIVLQAMARTKDTRYPTALAFQEALSGYLSVHAPRFTGQQLSNLVRLLFREELQAVGEEVELPQEFSQQVAAWAVLPPRQRRAAGSGAGGPSASGTKATNPGRRSRAGEPGSTKAATAAARPSNVAVPAKPATGAHRLSTGLIAGLAGGGLLLLGGLGAIGYKLFAEDESSTVVVPVNQPLVPLKPKEAPKPAAPALDLEHLPNHLLELPRAADSAFDGRTVKGLNCVGEPGRPEAVALLDKAEKASFDSHKEALRLLDLAIGVEPTAGKLYRKLIEEADEVVEPPDAREVARDVETFDMACAGQGPHVDKLLRRLSLVADPNQQSGAWKRPTLPVNPTAADHLARFEEELRHEDWDGAQADLDQAKALHGKTAPAQRKLEAARAAAKQKKLAELKNRAELLASQHQLGPASEVWRSAADLAPEDPDVCFQLAEALTTHGDFPGAAQEYRRFLTLAPNDPRAKKAKNLLKGYAAFKRLK